MILSDIQIRWGDGTWVLLSVDVIVASFATRWMGRKRQRFSATVVSANTSLVEMPMLWSYISNSDFQYTKGAPSTFARSDLENPVIRHFCGACGTGIGSRSPSRPKSMIVKVGTLDKPEDYQAQAAIFTCDKQAFHYISESIPSFEKRPPKK